VKKLARITYLIALLSICLLITWSIGVLVTTVFNLKVFQENTTEFALLSILPILATVAGAGIINIISNISLIANHLTGASINEKENDKKVKIGTRILLYGNLLLIVGLFGGSKISDKIKENDLKQEILEIKNSNKSIISKIPGPILDSNSINETQTVLEYIGKTNTKISEPVAIFTGIYKGQKVLYSVNSNSGVHRAIDSTSFLFRTSEKTRSKIFGALQSNDDAPFVVSDDNAYEIFILIKSSKNPFMLKMSKYSRYGRISS